MDRLIMLSPGAMFEPNEGKSEKEGRLGKPLFKVKSDTPKWSIFFSAFMDHPL